MRMPDAPAHHLGERPDAEDRDRRRHADAALSFGKTPAAAQRSLQGYSVAEWEVPARRTRRTAPGAARGNLKVTTTMMSAGWLRKNGVPYSENATLTEYFDRFPAPNGDEWFVVTTIVSDPKCPEPGLRHQHALQEGTDGAKWAPKPNSL